MRLPGPSGFCRIEGRAVSPRSAQVALTDPGLLAGLGLFETLAVHGGRALDLEAHLERLSRGAAALAIAVPDRARLRAELEEAARAVGGERGWLKLVVTAGGVAAVLGDRLDAAEVVRPAAAVLLPWRRSLHDPLVSFKTLNGGANLLGRREAARRGADEGLWLNARGHLAEGSSSNLFVLRGRRLCTPGEREGILPGVVRSVTLAAAAALGIQVQVGKLRLLRLETAREAFLTSSVRGVQPLVRWEGRALGTGTPGPLTRRLMVEVERLRLSGDVELSLSGRASGAGGGEGSGPPPREETG